MIPATFSGAGGWQCAASTDLMQAISKKTASSLSGKASDACSASIALAIDGAVRGIPALRGEVVLVTLSLETFKSIPIPSDIMGRLED